jgi:hypothetical protein
VSTVITPKPAPLARVAKGRKPQYFTDPATDTLLSMVLALTQELSVARDRIDTLERLLDRAGLLAADVVDAYLPTPEEAAIRADLRAAMLRRVFRGAEKDARDLAAGVGADPGPEVLDVLS